EALEDVAFLDVVVADDLHAAFLTGFDFLGVVLEPFELLEDTVLLDDDVVAGDADWRVAFDDTVGDIAASDRAHLGDAEDLPDLGVAENLFPDLRAEEAGRGLADIVDDVVDNAVRTQFNTLVLRLATGLGRGDDIEAEHDRAGGGGERDIGFGNTAHGGVEHADL